VVAYTNINGAYEYARMEAGRLAVPALYWEGGPFERTTTKQQPMLIEK
jgi:hypothetical protein